ncbi:MAG: tRNA epoxyqueuosine(34) reductase QueG [Phycisphaerales bacterium]|nr:tRNA epoxyqueuosine(34) reductase QueG [Planctomycetota bacterium]MBL6997437.1 tRNA epoxyqueuosine(34) reductase QueG [Phycisphaerales bacterium]
MNQLDASSIVELCYSADFALAGVTSAKRSSHDVALEQWLVDGKHGEMEWMNRNVDVRLDSRNILEGAKSVICVADRYSKLEELPLQEGHGLVARYARGKDYHKEMKRRLHRVCDILQEHFPSEKFRACVDTAPLLEREYGERSGIGAIGKHTLLLEQGVGSWMLLGCIVTTADISPIHHVQEDPCSTCTQCIDACPTDAITPWSVDARRCISYLTIEHRTAIDPELFSSIGKWLFGCDICQEVCPHNQKTQKGDIAPIHEAYSPKFNSLDVLELLGWDEEQRREAFSGSSMKRAKLGMMRRNAVIVAGNLLAVTPNEELLSALQMIAQVDDDPIVQETAVAVLLQL